MTTMSEAKQNLAPKPKIQGLGQQIYSITLRDLFAMEIASGILTRNHFDLTDKNIEDVAEYTWKIADAILAKRDLKES